jgi:CspA family cold shock protein
MRLQTGYVKFFNPTEGIGLISPNSGGDDIFVNRKAIATSTKLLEEGQRVEFSTQRSSRGLVASDVIVF